jgi:Domain of unknown function (DUF5916)/Carbohydrate family 9 binding domain-like
MFKIWPCLLLCLSSSAFAQNGDFFKPDSARKTIKAVKITTAIKVDGLLEEPEWSLAPPSARFIQVEPYQGQASLYTTQVKVLYNRQYLYFGIICKDPLGKKAIRATDFIRDFDETKHDLVGIAVDNFNDRRNAMVFATNPYGVQRDLLAFDDLYYDTDWDGFWKVRTNRTDSGWTAEIAIPWKTLRYPKTVDTIQSWGFNVYRNRRLTNELSAFSPFPRVFAATHMSYAGLLTNLQPPPPAPNVQVVPYFLTENDRYSNFGNTEPANSTSVKAGGDLKWAINQNSVLDLTYHTDFAQVDEDIEVNNTTRFSVLYPEKRPFFLENESLFGIAEGPQSDYSGGSMNYQPFFSRSIGLDTAGNPVPIVAGGRFVDRSAKLNYGAIVIRQQGGSDTAGTNFFVGRISRNFGGQDRIGALVSVSNKPDGSNIESTLDGFFRVGESNSINAILTDSYTTNTGLQGIGGMVQYYNTTNKRKIWWTESVFTKNFHPQMGFLSRTDVIGTTPGVNFYYRGSLLPFKSVLLGYDPGFLPELYYTASTGKFSELDLPVWPLAFNFKNGAFFAYGITASRQELTAVFQPLGVNIAPGNYHYMWQEIYANSDPSQVVNVSLDAKTGTYFNGWLNTVDFKVQFAPIPHISLSVEYNPDFFRGVGTPKTTTTVNLYILEARLSLNPRLQLSGIYQLNSLNNAANCNIRFSWEYSPLSYIYFVYNRGATNVINNTVEQTQAENQLIAKISFCKQF